MSRHDAIQCVVCGDGQSGTNFSCKYTVSEQTEQKYSQFFKLDRLDHGPLCNRCYRSWYKGTHPHIVGGRRKKPSVSKSSKTTSSPGDTSFSFRYNFPVTRNQRHGSSDGNSLKATSSTPGAGHTSSSTSSSTGAKPLQSSSTLIERLQSNNHNNNNNNSNGVSASTTTTSMSSASGQRDRKLDMEMMNSAANMLARTSMQTAVRRSVVDADSKIFEGVSQSDEESDVEEDSADESTTSSVDVARSSRPGIGHHKRTRSAQNLSYDEKLQLALEFIGENVKHLGPDSEQIVTRRFWAKNNNTGGTFWMKMVDVLREFRIVKATCRGGRRVEINDELFQGLGDVEEFLKRAQQGDVPEDLKARLVESATFYDQDVDGEDSGEDTDSGVTWERPRKRRRKIMKSSDDDGNPESMPLLTSNLGFVEREMKMHRAGKLNAEIIAFLAEMSSHRLITEGNRKVLMRHVLETENEQIFTNLVSAVELYKMGHMDLARKVLSHLFQHL